MVSIRRIAYGGWRMADDDAVSACLPAGREGVGMGGRRYSHFHLGTWCCVYTLAL